MIEGFLSDVFCDTKYSDPASGGDTAPLTLQCPPGGTITNVTFADYGTSSGQCGFFEANHDCSSNQLVNMTELCVGRSNCTLQNVHTFEGSCDPCVGDNAKHLSVSVVC